MKVQRKLEIAAEVAEAQGAYACGRFEMPARHVKAFEKWLKETVEQALAAHYEPVPEPPAEVPCRCDVEMFGKHCFDCPNSWAEARQGRERSAGRIDPQRVAQTNHNIKERMNKLWCCPPDTEEPMSWDKEASQEITERQSPVPHRATIAVIPCICTCGNFVIEIDGVIVRDETGSFWFGTEAEAQAKANELRNA